MNVIITLSGVLPDPLDEEDLDSLKEALEEEFRYSGGSGVVVEVEKA